MSITITSNISSEIAPSTVIGKYIERPQTAEQKEMETYDLDYDPNDDTVPESEDISSDEQNEESAQDISETEETIVNSIEFQIELASAIENVKNIAKHDMETIFEKAVKDYIDETGEQPTVLQMADAFQTFATETIQQEQAEIVSKDNEEEFINEFNESIEHTKKLGTLHQELFVEEICATFVELIGREPTIEELSNAFKAIRNNFADEAREEFIEINNEEEDSDSDYSKNSEDEQQIERDNQLDGTEKLEIVYINESEKESGTKNETDNEYDNSDDDESELIIGYCGDTEILNDIVVVHNENEFV